MSQGQNRQTVALDKANKKRVYSLIAHSPDGVNFGTIASAYDFGPHEGDKKLRSNLKNLRENGHIRYDKTTRQYYATHPTSKMMVVKASITEAGIELKPVKWSQSKATTPFMLVKKSDTEYNNIRDGDKLLVALNKVKILPIGNKQKVVTSCTVIDKIDSHSPVDLKAVFRRNTSGVPELIPAFDSTQNVSIKIDKYEGPYSAEDYPEGAIVSAQIMENASQHKLVATVKDLAEWNQNLPVRLLSQRDKANGLFRNDPFSAEEEEQARTIAHNAPEPREYEDHRQKIQFAIDPTDAKDHDDSVSAEPDMSPDNPGGWIITISDIDVVRFITQMKRASENALEHPLSAYTNDSVIHMLPKAWAEDAASLKDRQERFCVSVDIRYDSLGKKMDHRVYRSLNVSTRITYDEMDAFLQGQIAEHFSVEIIDQLNNLVGAYESLLIEDGNRETLNFEQGRTSIQKNNDGTLKAVSFETGSVARDIIKKFMIAGNLAFREECEILRAPTIDRIEYAPNIQDRLPARKTSPETKFLDREWTRSEILSVLDEVAGNPAMHQALSDFLIRRVMRPGKFTTEEIGHFGLGLDDTPYAPFNSPVRSLADLSNMMSLFDAKGWLSDYVRPGQREWLHDNIFGSIAQRRITESLNDMQPQVKKLQRDATRRQAIAYLNRYQGEIVEAAIQHVTDTDICLRIADCGYNFTFPLKSISGGAFTTDTQKQTAISIHNGQVHEAGSILKLSMIKADPITQQIVVGTAQPMRKDYTIVNQTPADKPQDITIVVEAHIIEATTESLKIQIGNKEFDLTSKLSGSKDMRESGLYHYATGRSMMAGNTACFRLTVNMDSQILECAPTANSYDYKSKKLRKFMKDHNIQDTREKVIQPSQKRQWQGLHALSSLLESPAPSNAE